MTRTVLVQTVPDVDETRDFLALADDSDLVSAVTGWVDLTGASVADDLAELAAAPGGRVLRAIRHGVQGEDDPAWLCRPDVRRGLAAVAGAGLRYELLTLPVQLPAAVETVEALPEAAFVLDHCSKPEIARGEHEPWGRADPPPRRVPQRHLQAVRAGDRGRPGVLGRRHPAALRRRGAGGLRPGPGDVPWTGRCACWPRRTPTGWRPPTRMVLLNAPTASGGTARRVYALDDPAPSPALALDWLWTGSGTGSGLAHGGLRKLIVATLV